MRSIRLVGMAVMLAGSLAGCGLASLQGGRDTEGYWLPLTVVVRFDPSVTGVKLEYSDACRQPKTISAGEQLTYVFRREIGLAFERVRIDDATSRQTSDGELEVSLGLKEIELAIPRQADKSHIATVHLGSTVAFRDQTGTMLYTKSLRTDVQGSVTTTRQSCDISGLAEIVNDAGLILAQGLKKHLGTSIKLQEYSKQREAAGR